jgi:hypothetical protein
MADTETQTPDETTATPDAAPDFSSFVPDTFKGEDGSYDVASFRSSFDELASFRAQYDEAKAALPEGPEGYTLSLPEDFKLIEGFDPESLKHTDEDGNTVEFDPASMFNPEDPDLPELQAMMHGIAQGEMTPVDAMQKITGLMVNRELRSNMAAQAEAAEQMKELGQNAQSRIDTIKGVLQREMPGPLANAVLNGLTSADAVRGLEALLKEHNSTVTPAPKAMNYGEMSVDERLELGLSQRAK